MCEDGKGSAKGMLGSRGVKSGFGSEGSPVSSSVLDTAVSCADFSSGREVKSAKARLPISGMGVGTIGGGIG